MLFNSILKSVLDDDLRTDLTLWYTCFHLVVSPGWLEGWCAALDDLGCLSVWHIVMGYLRFTQLKDYLVSYPFFSTDLFKFNALKLVLFFLPVECAWNILNLQIASVLYSSGSTAAMFSVYNARMLCCTPSYPTFTVEKYFTNTNAQNYYTSRFTWPGNIKPKEQESFKSTLPIEVDYSTECTHFFFLAHWKRHMIWSHRHDQGLLMNRLCLIDELSWAFTCSVNSTAVTLRNGSSVTLLLLSCVMSPCRSCWYSARLTASMD